MDELIQTIYEQLMVDIAPTRQGDAAILLIKVKNAYREIKQYRNYPKDYTEEQIDADMADHYTEIYNLALYDYNIRGAEFQTTINENGEYRSFEHRSTILAEVIPFASIA